MKAVKKQYLLSNVLPFHLIIVLAGGEVHMNAQFFKFGAVFEFELGFSLDNSTEFMILLHYFVPYLKI